MIASRAACATIVLLGMAYLGFAQEAVEINGYVYDAAGKGIKGVKVSLYTAGKKDSIETVRTNDDGFYKLARKLDATYDILYTQTKLDPAIVELLAENKNQQISIKMYKRGDRRPAAAYHASLQAAERLMLMILSIESPPMRAELLKEYNESGAARLLDTKVEENVEGASADVLRFLHMKKEEVLLWQTRLGLK